jgi:DNA-binding GntR family transcriptional regulator
MTGTEGLRSVEAVPVVDAIRAAIADGEFVPNQRLVEADLSERFGASRTNVRTALVQLASEGLVERVQNRGARVRAVSLAEAIEITEVRMALEGLCAARAAERLNRRLHDLVLELAGQTTAAAILERLRGQSVRHQFQLAMHPGRPAVSLPQHLEIIEAICAGDADGAEAAMRRHIRSVIDTLPEADTTRTRRFNAL